MLGLVCIGLIYIMVMQMLRIAYLKKKIKQMEAEQLQREQFLTQLIRKKEEELHEQRNFHQ